MSDCSHVSTRHAEALAKADKTSRGRRSVIIGPESGRRFATTTANIPVHLITLDALMILVLCFGRCPVHGPRERNVGVTGRIQSAFCAGGFGSRIRAIGRRNANDKGISVIEGLW